MAEQSYGIHAEAVSLTGYRGDAIPGYFARPLGDGPFPGVLVIHEAFGMMELTRETVLKFAAHGYLAIAPDLYTRIPGFDPTNMDELRNAMAGLRDEHAIGDMLGGVAYLKGLEQGNGKVGSIGHCSGGRHSFLLACNTDELDAAVNCYGGGVVTDEVTENRPRPVIDMAADLACPMLGLFGATDRNPNPEHVQRMDEELAKHGKAHEFHSYAEPVGHGFFATDRPSYEQAAAVDGWNRIFAFYDQHLR